MGRVGILSRYVEPMNLGLMCLRAYYICNLYTVNALHFNFLQVYPRVPWPAGTLFPRPCPSHEGHLHLCPLIGLPMAMRPSDCHERSLHACIYALPSL